VLTQIDQLKKYRNVIILTTSNVTGAIGTVMYYTLLCLIKTNPFTVVQIWPLWIEQTLNSTLARQTFERATTLPPHVYMS
jgi:hypothetical protein